MNVTTTIAATFWLLGLPFDVTTLDAAAETIVEAAVERKRLIFATPNLSFLRSAGADSSFQGNVLATQMSFVDGMVLVWLGRLLGVPFEDRVAGSDLIELLAQRSAKSEISMCFFGGPKGAAERAAQAINESAPGLKATGAVYPGYVDIDTMSDQQTLDAVNASRAQLLCVALGARKGHEWIERNRDRIEIPVISHLGAVINFFAGSVTRAPEWMRKTGLEWLWRIYQEPALASRYASDALWLGRTLLFAVLPVTIWRASEKLRSGKPLEVIEANADGTRISVAGSLTAPHLKTLSKVISEHETRSRLALDLRRVDDIDARALGYLYTLKYRQHRRLSLERVPPRIRRLMRWHRADVLLGGRGEPDAPVRLS